MSNDKNNRKQHYNMYNSKGFKQEKYNREKKKNQHKTKTEITEESILQQNRQNYKGMTLEQYVRGQSRAQNQNNLNQRKKEVAKEDQQLEYQKNFKIEQTDEENYKQSQRESKKYETKRIILPIVINPNQRSQRNILQLPLKTQMSEMSKQIKKIRQGRFPTMLQQEYDFLKNKSASRHERTFEKKQQKIQMVENEKSKGKISKLFTVKNNFFERPLDKVLTLSHFYKKNPFLQTKTKFNVQNGKLTGYATKYNSKFRHFSKQK